MSQTRAAFPLATRIPLGGVVLTTPEHKLTWTLLSGGVPGDPPGSWRFRFEVTPRTHAAEGADGVPPPGPDDQPLRSFELELAVGESEVLPLVRAGSTRLLLTVLEFDEKAGELRVMASKVCPRVPKVLKSERAGAPGPSDPAAAKRTVSPAGSGDAPDETATPGADHPAPGGCPHKRVVVLTPPMRLVLRMGLGQLASRCMTSRSEAERIAVELFSKIDSDEDCVPALMRLFTATLENVPPAGL